VVDEGIPGEERVTVDLVIPTVGRPSLGRLLGALAAAEGPAPGAVLVVDDRRQPDPPLPPPPPGLRVRVLRGPAAGPAAARNAGWRESEADWVAFLDDDVVPGPAWLRDLAADLDRLPPEVGASQGRLRVPLPAGRRPTDWERSVQGLEASNFITADIAYRRAALAELGGFDERFPRAYREDADLALRAERAGWRLVRGRRQVEHPVPPAGPLVSLRRQSGNADDALMLLRYGLRWRERAGAHRGRRRRHLAITGAAALALAAAALRRPRLGAAAGAAWLAGTAELAAARIRPGPRTPLEVAAMAVTSVAIPPLATWHWLRGLAAHAGRTARRTPEAVLFDRDGTLVVDVPYNGDPARVEPMPGARAALDRLRRAGIAIGVVSNQSGVGRGVLTRAQVERVNRRVEEVLGPIGAWAVCPHAPEAGCGCRKPLPALVHEAAARLGTTAGRCAVVGDIGADVEAARAAGARAILVPTPATLAAEVAAAPELAPDIEAAVDRLLGGAGRRPTAEEG
jgi:HAD superfamily hydrolase (TIGR01662 family)